jgi:hypothetical protein
MAACTAVNMAEQQPYREAFPKGTKVRVAERWRRKAAATSSNYVAA